MLSLPRNIDNVCRLCLTESVDGSDMLPLFPVRGGNPLGPNTVVSKILLCTTVKIEHFEGAPATICEYCITRLEDWQAFREQCVGTDEYLRNSLRNKQHQQQQQLQQPEFQTTLVDHQQQHGTEYAEDNTMTVLVEDLEDGGPDADGVVGEEDGDEGESYLIGEELSAEDVMQQDEYYEMMEQTQQEPESLVQQMNRKNGIRVPKWSKEFGAKLNSLLHVVGGERPHQCKLCRKRFLRRPHCRRHVAQAHAAEIDEVVLPKNWELLAGRRFAMHKAQIQPLIEPVPPPPGAREEQYEPTIYRPHQCEICRKCFKRPQHLRRHKTSHLQIEIDRSEIMAGIEAQQKATQQLLKLTNGHRDDEEDDDVIALSDDEYEEDGVVNGTTQEDEDMGEEISPEEFNGLQQFLDDEEGGYEGDESTNHQAGGTDGKRLGLSDIVHMYYDESDSGSQQSESTTLLTKQGTARKRAPPMEKVPGDRPYQCNLCYKLFKRSDHLKSHMKVHSSETDYSCPHCQKGFRYRQNYLIHLKNRTCSQGRGKKRRMATAPPKLQPKPKGAGVTVKQFDGNGTVRHKYGVLLGD